MLLAKKEHRLKVTFPEVNIDCRLYGYLTICSHNLNSTRYFVMYEKPTFSSLNMLYVSEHRLQHVNNIVVVAAAFFLRALTKRKFTLIISTNSVVYK